MSRYTGPKARINRKYNQAIFAPSKATERKPYPPGIHGPRLRRKLSEYSIGLNEKQKLRFMYGLTEKQFRLTFARAKKQKGVTGEVFVKLLETRLDNVVYRLGLAKTRRGARQFVGHGHIMVNKIKVDIPSYSVKAGDIIEVRDRTSSKQLATANLEDTQYRPVMPWLEMNAESMQGTFVRLPEADEVETGVNAQLIVEFYSR
jgi:small subunit ribosomal protein S4